MSDLPRIFVVSLERSQDRRASVRQWFTAIDVQYEIVNAVDGTRLTDEELQRFSPWRTYFHYGRSFGRGTLACSLSHLRVMQRIVDEGLSEAVVFEDDTEPGFDIREILGARDWVPADADVVTLHSLFSWADPQPTAHLEIAPYRVCTYRRTPMGTQCYLVTRAGAARLLEVGYPVCLPADELLFRPRPAGLRVYGIEPAPVRHHDYPSEIHARTSPPFEAGALERTALGAAALAGRVARRLDRGRAHA
jgi:glycosyl transferase family 25